MITSIYNKKILIFFLSLVVLSTNISLAVWSQPTADPIGDNTDPPINVGGTGQIKQGGISVGGDAGTAVGLRVLNGSVGIGIGGGAPAQKLHVGGFIRADSGFCIVGDCRTTWPDGDIHSVTAGAGLTGGGTSGNVTLDVGAGSGITVDIDSVRITSPTISCPGGQAIQSFNLSNGTRTCVNIAVGPGLPAENISRLDLSPRGTSNTRHINSSNLGLAIGIARAANIKKSLTVYGSSGLSSYAYCPSKTRVMSGGCEKVDLGRIHESGRHNDFSGGWYCEANEGYVIAYAVCENTKGL